MSELLCKCKFVMKLITVREIICMISMKIQELNAHNFKKGDVLANTWKVNTVIRYTIKGLHGQCSIKSLIVIRRT